MPLKINKNIKSIKKRFRYAPPIRLVVSFDPPYSKEFKTLILDYCADSKEFSFDRAIDIACGDGKSTRIWVDRFQSVYGVDENEDMLKKRPNEDVKFIDDSPYDLRFRDNSVDLVTIGLGYLWIQDKDTFYMEMKRVLKDKGVLAVFAPKYVDMELDRSEATDHVAKVMRILEKGKYYAPEVAYNADTYNDHVLPFRDFTRHTLRSSFSQWTVEQLIEFIESWESYRCYINMYPESTLLLDLKSSLELLYGESGKFTMRFPMFIMLGRK